MNKNNSKGLHVDRRGRRYGIQLHAVNDQYWKVRKKGKARHTVSKKTCRARRVKEFKIVYLVTCFVRFVRTVFMS